MSDFGKLNWADIGKGLLIAVVSSALTAIYSIVQPALESGSWDFTINWGAVIGVAAAAGLGYIMKNLVTNSENKLLKKEMSK